MNVTATSCTNAHVSAFLAETMSDQETYDASNSRRVQIRRRGAVKIVTLGAVTQLVLKAASPPHISG